MDDDTAAAAGGDGGGSGGGVVVAIVSSCSSSSSRLAIYRILGICTTSFNGYACIRLPSALLVLVHSREDEDEFFYISQAVLCVYVDWQQPWPHGPLVPLQGKNK